MNELTMTAPAATGLTVEQFHALPDVPGVQRQLVDGEIFVSPSPVVRHQLAQSRLLVQLANQLEGTGAQVFVAPLDLKLASDTVVQPDLMVFDAAGARSLDPEGWPDVLPVLVVEVLSPSTSAFDLGRKRDAYARAGIPEYWIVSCAEQTIDVLRLGEDAYDDGVSRGLDDTLTTPLLPTVAVDVAAVLATPAAA